MRNVGNTIIYRAFSSAYYVLTTEIERPNTKRHREFFDCLFYIQGSGLENTINYFKLNLDAEDLRGYFFYEVRRLNKNT